ncbi:hypothetical protein ACJ41O_009215 [Fusarium nematophilum]
MQTAKFITLIGVASQQVAAQLATGTGLTTATATRTFDEQCESVWESFTSEGADLSVYPSTISDMAIEYIIGSFYNTDDPCKLPAVTDKADAKGFSDWASSYMEWQSEHITEYGELWAACSDEPVISALIPIGPNHCSNLAAEITGSSDDDDDSAGSSHGTSLGMAIVVAGMVIAGLY